MVKCKYFADANITNILNIRKFFEIFFKKNSPSPPHSLIFAIKARQQVYQSTSCSQTGQTRDGSDGSENKTPPKHLPKKLVDLLTR